MVWYQYIFEPITPPPFPHKNASCTGFFRNLSVFVQLELLVGHPTKSSGLFSCTTDILLFKMSFLNCKVVSFTEISSRYYKHKSITSGLLVKIQNLLLIKPVNHMNTK